MKKIEMDVVEFGIYCDSNMIIYSFASKHNRANMFVIPLAFTTSIADILIQFISN